MTLPPATSLEAASANVTTGTVREFHQQLDRLTTERHPCELETVADDREISASEDEDEDGGKGSTSSPGILPTKQGVEERMIVCLLSACAPTSFWYILTRQRSIVRSSVGRGLTGASKRGEFVARSIRFVLDGGGHGTLNV